MGKIEIDHTGSGSGVTLSSDGTSLLLGGSAIGGGGADLYTANESSPTAQPSATGGNAIAIGDSAIGSGDDALAGPLSRAAGNGSVALGINSNSTSYGAGGNFSVSLGYQSRAMALQSNAMGSGAYVDSDSRGGLALGDGPYVQQCDYGVAIGLNARVHGGNSVTRAMALGASYSSGQDSLAAQIGNGASTYGATGANSIAMGYQAKATGNYAVAIGGTAESTGSDYGVSIGYRARSANHSTVSIGREAGLSGMATSSVAIGDGANGAGYSGGTESLALGKSVTSNGYGSTAIGRYAHTGGIQGKIAFSNDYMSNAGDNQRGLYILQASTTDATATPLTFSSFAAGTVSQLNLQNNSAYAFHGTIVARESAASGTDCAAWKVEGLIRREGSAGTTVLVNSTTTVLDNTPSWGMTLSANTTHGCLRIEVTGAASTSIRWVATIDVSELIYS